LQDQEFNETVTILRNTREATIAADRSVHLFDFGK
jgi:hypothetical protein